VEDNWQGAILLHFLPDILFAEPQMQKKAIPAGMAFLFLL
jgi:hypothetical protein